MNLQEIYGYIRVSTNAQGEGASLEVQKKYIIRFAEQKGLHILKFFVEKKSASKGYRPVYDEMIFKMKQGGAQGYVVHKYDRACRNDHDEYEIKQLIDYGFSILSATEDYDFNKASGRLMFDITGSINKFYSRNLSEEAKKGLYGRLDEGIYPFQAPIGYIDQGKGKLKTIDPQKAPLIKKVFQLYTKDGYSIRALVKKMYILGLRNTRGNKVQKNGMIRILKNPYYAGVMKIKNTCYPGKHKPIILMKTWKRTQDIMAGKSNLKIRKHAYTYRRLIRCSECNYRLVGEKQKGRVYYRCQTKGCPTKTIREDYLNRYVHNLLSTLCLQDIEIDYINNLINETEKDIKKLNDSLIRKLNLRIGVLEKTEDKLMDTLIKGLISEEQFQKRNQKILVERQELIDEKRNLTSNLSKNLKKYDDFLELVKSPVKLYDLADSEEKRELLDILTSNLQLQGKRLVISAHSPFKELLNRELLRFGTQDTPNERNMAYTFYPMTSPIILGRRTDAELKTLCSHLLEVVPSLPDFNHLLKHEIPTNNPSTKRGT